MPRRNGVMLLVASLVLAIAGVAGTLAFADWGANGPGQVAQAQESRENRGIHVSGEGQVSVEPDTAKVVLGVDTEGENLEPLREEANSRMNDVIQALQELGIEENDIRTVTYDISVREEKVQPESQGSQSGTGSSSESENVSEPDSGAATEEDRAEEEAAIAEEEGSASGEGESSESMQATEPDDGEPRITGYEIRQLVEVTVRDIGMTGDVIDTALDAGANRVTGVRFEVEDRAGAIEQARELAVENARQKAEHLAELTGVSVGSPLYIDERSPSLPVERMEETAMDADGGAGASAPIQPGESVIRVNVNIVYGIE